MADRRQLAQGLMMMTPAMREDLAGREQDIQRGKIVELLRRAGKEMYENPIVNTAVGLSPVLGDIQAGVEAYRSAQAGDWGNAGLNAVGMLPFVPALAGTFVGKGAKTWDAIQAAEAAKRLEAGEDAAKVWKETGYGTAPWDKQPRSEISDVAATINPNIDVIHGYGVSTAKELTAADRLKEANELFKQGFSADKVHRITGYKDTGNGLEDLYVNPYASVVEHKELGAAYPSLSNLKTEIAQAQGELGGYYDPNKDLIRLYSADREWNKLPQTKSDMLHELTHAIQTREGWARGGSSREMAQEIADADQKIVDVNKQMDSILKSMDEAKASGNVAKYDKFKGLYDEAMDYKLGELVPLANRDPYQSYRSLAGEAEARLVQARKDMTPEELLVQYPYEPAYFKEKTGIPLEDLITRFDETNLINRPLNK